MQDRRQEIIEAGLETLREYGYIGFTQPRVAKRGGVRQSHLTYYFPTRLDLLAAVARTAIDRQLGAIDKVLQGSMQEVAQAIARVATRHENTRVMMALAQAADQEPVLRELFRELADGIVSRSDVFLKSINKKSTLDDARMLHALSVGIAVVDLATARPDSAERIANTLQIALKNLSTPKR